MFFYFEAQILKTLVLQLTRLCEKTEFHPAIFSTVDYPGHLSELRSHPSRMINSHTHKKAMIKGILVLYHLFGSADVE